MYVHLTSGSGIFHHESTLAQSENLKISNFGSFVVKQKNNRCGRRPRTGEAIIIGTRRALSFKTSSILKNRINEEQSP